MNSLYRENKFIGEYGSLEHRTHIAIRAFLNRDDKEDAENAILDFRNAAGEDRDVAERVVHEFPMTDLIDSENIRRAFLDEAADVWRDEAIISSGRKVRTFLTTRDLTAQIGLGAGYVIKGLLSRQSYAMIYGAPGEGKTFTALDMAYAVAQGREWMGHKVNGGIVVYVPFEGAGGLAKRVQALVQKYGHADNFRAIRNPTYNLRELKGRKEFGEDLAAALNAEMPIMIVFDTLARCLNGDENSAKDVSAFNAAVAALIENTRASVVVIHHSGKDKSAGARGSSALLGAVDTEIQIDGNRIISTKQRDCELNAPIGFKLTPVTIGTDEDGDALTSCYVEPEAVDSRKNWKPTGRTLDAWSALCEVSPNNAPISNSEWRAAFARKAYPVEEPAVSALKKAFQRAVKSLVEAGWVNETEVGWQRPFTNLQTK